MSVWSSKLSDYHIKRLIGKGAFGSVYMALHHGEQIAIKVISNKLLLYSENYKDRIKNEIKLHSSLNHPAILGFRHYFEDEDNFYVVMEHCEEELLSKSKQTKFDENEIKLIFLQICHGVEYLHSINIIHRDLKLSNILITNQKIKIADFGLAVFCGSEESKAICGTPNYISPEIILYRKYGFESDVWSLGCILFYLITGKLPFQGENALRNIVKHSLNYPNGLDELARDLLNNLLQVDVKKRFTLKQILCHDFLKIVTLIPLNTFRLKEIRQETKYGNIALLSNGFIELKKFSSKFNRKLISPDGLKIFIDDICYEIWNLPLSYHKIYKFLSLFIEIIKSKTTKILLYADNAKCHYMENTPLADFFCYFEGKLEIRKLNSKKCYQINGKLFPFASAIPKEYKLAIEKLESFYKHCLLLNNKTNWSNAEVFPLVHNICTTYPLEETFEISKIQFNEGYSTIFRNQSNNEAFELTSTKDFGTSAFKTMNDIGESASARSPDKICFCLNQVKFLPHVGWCIQLGDSKFLLLFSSGQQMLIDDQELEYVDFGKTFRFAIDKNLPPVVKEKLSHFTSFAKLYK